MKKNLFMVAAVALFAAVSCNKEFEQMNPQDDILVDNIVSFEASIDESNTKTTLEGTKTMWIDEEWIQIVGTKSYWFNSEKLENPSEKAIFSYNGGNGAYVEEGSIMAVYPAGSKNYTFDADNKTIKNVEIPVSQTATLNNYDKNAALMVAYANATDATLQFKNATALLKFAVTNDNVKSFTFFGHNEEPISGNVSITVTENTDVPLTIQGFKPDSDKLYLVPNSNWKVDNARFAAYFFGNGDIWVSMTDADGDGIYEVAKQSGFPSVIFCRMNPSLTANNWDNKWNQTTDLTIPTNGNNLYTVKDGTWDEGGGTWSMFKNSYVELAAKEGFLASGQSYYAAIAPCVFEKGFAVELEIDGKKHQVKSYDKPYTINRNTIIDLGTLTYIQKQERNLAYEHSSISVILGNSFTNTLAGCTDGVQYSSSDPTVATVDENGTVTVVKEGTTTITAVAPETETYYAGEASYTLTVTKKTDRGLKFSSDKASLINGMGTSSTLSGITDGVKYLSSDNSVATVDATTGAVTMVSPGVVTITAAAPETEEYEAGEASYTLSLNMLYLKPNSNWKADNARFAAYFFGNGETWVSMTKSGDYYEVKVPKDKKYPNIIFCRMNPSASANNWNNKWNQTGDLTIPTNGNNLFTLPNSSWDGATATWSVKP